MQAKDNDNDPADFCQNETQVEQQSTKRGGCNPESNKNETKTENERQSMRECHEAVTGCHFTTGSAPAQVPDISRYQRKHTRRKEGCQSREKCKSDGYLCNVHALPSTLNPVTLHFCLSADYNGAVIRKRDAHLSLRQRNIGGRPAEDPFRIFRRDVDAAVRAFLAEGIVPERSMDRDAISADHRGPGNGGRRKPRPEGGRPHV